MLYNVEFAPSEGMTVWLDLADENLVDPVGFAPIVLLNGVPLVRTENLSAFQWRLPEGISFGVPSDEGLTLSILQ